MHYDANSSKRHVRDRLGLVQAPHPSLAGPTRDQGWGAKPSQTCVARAISRLSLSGPLLILQLSRALDRVPVSLPSDNPRHFESPLC